MTDESSKRYRGLKAPNDRFPPRTELIALLRADARQPVASLALGLSRTVQDRLKRLEDSGIIAGYSLKLSRGIDKGIRAIVTIAVEPRRQIGWPAC
jgi:DNA-binding Lrp family transcriptional regulator